VNADQLDRTDAELVDDAREARAEGIATAENAADPRLEAAIDAAIARANAAGKPWSVNDIRREFPVVSSGLVGARVRAAMMRRPLEMIAVSTTPSTLRNTHSKDVTVWLGVSAFPDATPDSTGTTAEDIADAITLGVSAFEAAARDLARVAAGLDVATRAHLLDQLGAGREHLRAAHTHLTRSHAGDRP